MRILTTHSSISEQMVMNIIYNKINEWKNEQLYTNECENSDAVHHQKIKYAYYHIYFNLFYENT